MKPRCESAGVFYYRRHSVVIASERDAIQLMIASFLPRPSRSPLANPQLDCVAPARNDGLVITNEREANQIMSSSRACEAIQLMLENSLLSSTTLIN
jgi:hypothetical protein